MLKNSDNESEIKSIISALKWKYAARDHGQLRSLDIFRILHEGNGSKDSLLRQSWGKNLNKKVISSESERQLHKDVLGLFEQLFLLTVGRIVSDNQAQSFKLKSSGHTSVPSLMKAQSTVDENMSEYVVAQSFEVIFKELGRYVKMVKGFKGIDWQNYVRVANKAVKEGSNAHDPHLDHKVLDWEAESKCEFSEQVEENEGAMVLEQINRQA